MTNGGKERQASYIQAGVDQLNENQRSKNPLIEGQDAALPLDMEQGNREPEANKEPKAMEKNPSEKEAQGLPHKGHRQRLKEQCLAVGFDGMPSHQVLEVLLFYAMPQRDTNKLAHELIEHFGSFAGVLNADYQELLQIPGVGSHTASLLALLPEFFRRYQLDSFGKRPCIRDRRQLGEYAQSLFTGASKENMYMLCMDAQHNLKGTVVINKGTINQVYVYPRETVELALRYNARFVALAHNHPGGALQPSAADVQLTERLAAILNSIGITMVDHVIVAGDSYYSFAEHGLLRGDCLPPPQI